MSGLLVESVKGYTQERFNKVARMAEAKYYNVCVKCGDTACATYLEYVLDDEARLSAFANGGPKAAQEWFEKVASNACCRYGNYQGRQQSGLLKDRGWNHYRESVSKETQRYAAGEALRLAYLEPREGVENE